MTTLVKYGLGGAASLLLLATLLKRKKKTFPSSPALTQGAAGKTYVPLKGDRPTAVFARFGTDFNAMSALNGPSMLMNKPIKLPLGAVDSGPKPQAMGKVQ